MGAVARFANLIHMLLQEPEEAQTMVGTAGTSRGAKSKKDIRREVRGLRRSEDIAKTGDDKLTVGLHRRESAAIEK